MVSPGDSLVPANKDPSITESAPAAIALGISPVYRIPPSAITGTPVPFKAAATSNTAENCGKPTPATTLVVQIEPGPIPTFTASAPFSTKNKAASGVAMLPTTTSRSGKAFLTSLSTVTTPFVCPWAVSITTASTPALTSALALSTASAVTPNAAATRNLPYLSLLAIGFWVSFVISLKVINPTSLLSASTTGSFSILYCCKIPSASINEVPS